MNALRCRAYAEGQDDPCGKPAAVGLVTEGDTGMLELLPLCQDHAPEEIHEASISMHASEFAIVSLAYGTSEGSLT